MWGWERTFNRERKSPPACYDLRLKHAANLPALEYEFVQHGYERHRISEKVVETVSRRRRHYKFYKKNQTSSKNPSIVIITTITLADYKMFQARLFFVVVFFSALVGVALGQKKLDIFNLEPLDNGKANLKPNGHDHYRHEAATVRKLLLFCTNFPGMIDKRWSCVRVLFSFESLILTQSCRFWYGSGSRWLRITKNVGSP